MKILSGQVRGGYGVASDNLRHVVHLIQARTGLSPLVDGTFNLGLTEPYMIIPDAQIEISEYNLIEFIKLQRCRVGGLQALIMRPNNHEQGCAQGLSQIEIMSTAKLRNHLGVKDGDTVSVEVEGDEQWWLGSDFGQPFILADAPFNPRHANISRLAPE